MFIIETWRWRFVIFCLGVALLWTGGYCLLHPDDMPLNICYSRTSVFLQRLNLVATFATFVAVTGAGGMFVYFAAYSARKAMHIREERKPLDYRNIGRTIVAYVVLVIIIGVGVVLVQWVFRGTSLHPLEDPLVESVRGNAD